MESQNDHIIRQTRARLVELREALGRQDVESVRGDLDDLIRFIEKESSKESAPSPADPIPEHDKLCLKIIQTIDEGICLWNATGAMIVFSPAMTEITGYTKNDFGPELHGDIETLYPDAEDRRKALEARQRSSAVPGHQERTICRPDGSEREVIAATRELVLDGETWVLEAFRDVTADRRASDALKRSEALFAAVSEQMPDSLFLIDMNDDEVPGRILYANAAAAQSHQCSVETLIGRPITDLDDLHGSEHASERMHRLLAGETLVFEGSHVRKDGTRFPVEVTACMIQVGEQRLALALDRDITERNRTNKKLREQHQLMEGILRDLPVVAFRINQDGIYEQSIGAGLWRVGLVDHEAVGTSAIVGTDEERSNIMRALAGNSVHFESRGIQFGKPWAYENFVAFDEVRGSGAVGFAIDITERTRAEERLKASEERFRQLAENIHGVFWLTDVTRVSVIYVSPAYEAIWGRPAAALYGSSASWLHTVHPDDFPRVKEAFNSRLPTGDYDETYRIQRPDGEIRWIRDRGFPVRNLKGEIYRYAGIAEDVTERKWLEREILEIGSREHLKIGQEIHDGVGQELTGLGYLAQSVTQKLTSDGSSVVDNAQLLADGIQDVIRSLRLIARGLVPVQIDANGLMAALAELVANAESRCGIRCRFECPEPTLVHDNDTALHMFRIAQEAVNNAIRHAEANLIEVKLEQTAGFITLRIKDNGVGFDDSETSTGLGLRTMEFRAGLIGARLEIRNRKPGGTVVTCRIHNDPHAHQQPMPVGSNLEER